MPSLLAAVTGIADVAGTVVDLTDVEQLRIGAGLTVTRVTNNGLAYVLISVTAADPVYPGSVPVKQPTVANGEVGSGGSTREILVYASTSGPTHVGTVDFFAGGSLTASDTDYITWSIFDCDVTGSHNGGALATGTTKLLASGGSGPWTGGGLAFSVGLGIDLAADHSLAIEWDTATHAATRSNPGGWYRIS